MKLKYLNLMAARGTRKLNGVPSTDLAPWDYCAASFLNRVTPRSRSTARTS
jgi:hypothetical protein